MADNVGSGRVGDDVGSSVADRVLVGAVPVAGVDSVAGVPGAGVERAVGAKRNIVLGKNVGSEEVAGLVAAVLSRVVNIVGSLSLASGGAEGRVVRVVVEQPHTGVCIVAVVERSIDSSRKAGTRLEVRDRGKGLALLRVTVGTDDNNVEGLTVGILGTAPLAVVGSSARSNIVTVDRALDVGDGFRVGAAVLGLILGVTLEEDVETLAVRLRVTEVGAALDVVGVEILVGKVTNLLRAASQVIERQVVASGSVSTPGGHPQRVGGSEVSICAAITRNISSSNTAGECISAGAVALLNDTLALDNRGGGGSGNSRVVRDRSSLGGLDIRAEDSRSGNSQSSLDVDHLRSGSDSAEKGGGSNSVTHLDDCG